MGLDRQHEARFDPRYPDRSQMEMDGMSTESVPAQVVSNAWGKFDGRTFEEWMKFAEKTPGGADISRIAGCMIWIKEHPESKEHRALIQCPRCNRFAVGPLRTQQGGMQSAVRAASGPTVIGWARNTGWQAGKRRSKVACPVCISIEKEKKGVAMKNQVVSIESAVAIRDQEAATKRRALIAKVNEEILALYPVREKGYVSGGSDEIVAKKTGASVAFVAEERERGFGPANVIDLRAVEIKIATMQRIVEECEEKAMAALQLADSQVKAARALVADLKARL